MQSDTSSHAVLGKSVQNEPLKKIYMFFFDYWTVFSTLIQFIHELAPRSLWLKPGDNNKEMIEVYLSYTI